MKNVRERKRGNVQENDLGKAQMWQKVDPAMLRNKC